MGRIFDAVAALAGVRLRASYEGQAAMELEWRASAVASDIAYAFEFRDGLVDARPVISAVVDDRLAGVPSERIARRFHDGVVDMIANVCDSIRSTSGLDEVAFGGGVFQNAIVTSGAIERLRAAGFGVHAPCEVPPNDGGLALGQLAIAAAREAA
jgi:hydrogenase maturation protein HypF